MEFAFSSSNHYSINGHDLLDTQANHYHRLSDSPTDDVLRYIDKMLMEEDMEEDMLHALQESSDFQDKERSFYELLGQNYPQQLSRDLGFPVDPPLLHEATKVMTSSKKNRQPAEEFDTWTSADGGCNQEFEAQISDLRKAASESCNARKIGHDRGIKEVANLRSLLIMCAKSLAADDHPAARELLRQIGPYTSPIGNVNQRVAHYFVLGLEARMAGTGSWMPNAFNMDRLSASDYFTAYCTSFISISFRKVSFFASSKVIAVKSKKYARVHVIDLGILYGVQWPAFIQNLAEREGGPPHLRITGIDQPQPNSCDSAERIVATGSRLAYYAKMFGVPFEYNAIVQSWESIRVGDLKIEEGEFVAVNCLLRAENLPDEMVAVGSPRRKVVDLIRKINPDIFVHAVVSAGYGVPYFVSRFREALFHFSAVFDMMEIVVPKERPERMLLQGMLGSEIVNVIACEGAERVPRPETHKQWQLCHSRAGFKQVSFGRELVGTIQNKVRSCYHKEFATAEDHKWLLMSWKGRTICAISCWKPVAPV